MKITFIKTNKGKRLKENEKRFNKSKKADNEYKVSIDNNHRINISDTKINEKIHEKINEKNNHKSRVENNHKSRVENNHKKNNEKIMEGLKVILKKNQLVLLTLALMLISAGYMNYNNSSNELDISLAELGDAKLVSTNITENGDYIEESNVDETSASMENEVTTNGNIANQNEVENSEINKDEANSSQVNQNEINNIEVSQNDLNNDQINENKTNQTSNNSASTMTERTSNNTETEDNNYFVQTRLERETMYSQMLETYEKILEKESIPSDQKSIASNEIKNINNRKNAISIVENLIKTKGFEEVVILINDNNIDVVVKNNNNLTTEQVAQITNIVSRELNSKIEDIHISIHK